MIVRDRLTFTIFAPGTFTLNILNWVNSPSFPFISGVDGTDDRLIINSDQTGNLAFFSFNGTPATEIPLDNGFFETVPLTPVPEPSTWIGGMLAVGVVGWSLLKSRKLKYGKADERQLVRQTAQA